MHRALYLDNALDSVEMIEGEDDGWEREMGIERGKFEVHPPIPCLVAQYVIVIALLKRVTVPH